MTFLRSLAKFLSELPIYLNADKLWQANQKNFWLPLNKLDKLYLGSYLLLRDYAAGIFPPTFENQSLAYEAESNFIFALPGVDPAEALETEIRKPFWLGNERYLKYFIELCEALEKCGVKPPQTILELGAGSGWMSEFLAAMKFKVIATTIAPSSVEQIQKRSESLEVKGIKGNLKSFQAAMESIDLTLQEQGEPLVDVIFVFEALHHAYNWQKTFTAVSNSLKPGGWFIICREPNLLHTLISYRVAKLSNTHEIGMSRREMINSLRKNGFQKQIVLKNHLHFFIKPHWIAAQK